MNIKEQAWWPIWSPDFLVITKRAANQLRDALGVGWSLERVRKVFLRGINQGRCVSEWTTQEGEFRLVQAWLELVEGQVQLRRGQHGPGQLMVSPQGGRVVFLESLDRVLRG